jgi:hypothetical protein
MMRRGLLWYDDDPRHEVKENIICAARRYEEKFGCKPDTCLVHPDTLAKLRGSVDTIRIMAVTTMLPHHYLVGVAEG